MKSQSQQIQVVKELHHIYPDIEGQLCSRHSTLFGKLRTTFNKLYDNMEPNNYVIVKGNCEFVEESLTELKLSMALENGVISLVSKTYPMAEIYVNCNHFGEEVIFSSSGQLQQGLNMLSVEMSGIIKSATSNLPQSQIQGGILYMHANIPEEEFNYKQAFLIGFYLSVLSINDNFKNFTISQLVDKMSQLQFMGSRQQIERQFVGYRNNKFNLTLPDLLSMKGMEEIVKRNERMIVEEGQCKKSTQKTVNHKKYQAAMIQKSQLQLDINKQYKFLFCKLDLAKEDVGYELRRRKEIQQRKEQLLGQLKEKHQVSTLFELFHQPHVVDLATVQFQSQYHKSYNPKSMQELECEDEDEILTRPNEFLSHLMNQIALVSDFSNEKINLEQLVDNIWKLNSQGLKLHSDEVVELVEDMKQALQINACMIVNRDFLLMVVHKNQFTEILCEVKHKMNRGELKSKSLFRIEDEELVVQRWASDKVIGEKIFSSVPSEGVGVFDPSEAIWFD